MARRHAAETGLVSRLDEVRKSRGLTQAKLADAVGVTRKTISTVENAVFVPSTVLALKLASVLEVRVEDLFALGVAVAGEAADRRARR